MKWASFLSPYLGGPIALIFGPSGKPTEEDGHPAEPQDMLYCLRKLFPVPFVAALVPLAAEAWEANRLGFTPQVWPWTVVLTFWLGDYLLLLHLLRYHVAGHMAPWTPMRPQFSLRTLVLAVLAWGAYLTGLQLVWGE